MSDNQPQTVDSPGADVDALVARYAPVGRRLRRRRELTRLALAVLVPTLSVTAVLIFQARSLVAEKAAVESSPAPDVNKTAAVDTEQNTDRIERALDEIRDLKASLETETGAVTAQRAELARQQELVSRKNRQLSAKLDTINTQRTAMAKQGREIETQKVALLRALEKANEQRRKLQASTGSRSSIERELLDIDRQKRLLEEQQRQFVDQGQSLAKELAAINQQRTEIEKQRQSVEEQQAEVGKLLEQAAQVDPSH